jgi:L-2-hydroxyglutarate oxidase LhgO
MRCDATVIGGGVVGLATAVRLAECGMSVVLLERHDSFGQETSSRNSEVIHAGMYYPTGSLKARLCVAGNRSIYAWCESHRVSVSRLGKFIVATHEEQLPQLAAIEQRAQANGVNNLRWARPGELEAAEPSVRAVAALFSPDTGIVDSHGLMESLAARAADLGAALAWGHRYLGAEQDGSGYLIRLRGPADEEITLSTRRVVNAAGLEADSVAAGLGLDIDALNYRLCFVKGVYFRLGAAWRGRLRHLIYPVPLVGLAGLGCHVTLDLAGEARLGPDVQFLADRSTDYSVPPSRAADFLEGVRHYLPDLTLDQLRPDQAGIRPRRVLADRSVSPDFVIAEETANGAAGWVNLIGIESPGLTCCLDIGDEVARLLAGAD